MEKLVILDRDGVINEDSDEYIKSLDEWIPIPGSIEAIATLSKAGFHIAIATNQSGVARGFFSIETLSAMHQRLVKLVQEQGGKIDKIVFCPHGPDDRCECRKPKDGLFRQIETAFRRDLTNVPVVGDSYRDLVPAFARGASPILVKTGKGEKTLAKHSADLKNVPVFDNLAQAAQYIINNF